MKKFESKEGKKQMQKIPLKRFTVGRREGLVIKLWLLPIICVLKKKQKNIVVRYRTFSIN